MSPNGIIRIFICLATLAGATLVSCRRTGHEEPVPGTGTERPDDVRVSFRIALGSTNGTRAGGTPEGSYDDGTQSEFGLYITTVDGYTADESAQEWWCLTKGGQSVNTGVDSTPIADGDAFELTLTTGW